MEPTTWAEQAIQDYFEGGFSYREIAERYGRDYRRLATLHLINIILRNKCARECPILFA